MTRWLGAVILLSCVTSSSVVAQRTDAESARRDFPVPADVAVVREVVYAEYGARQLKLDVYLPPRRGRRPAAPGVLVVRGGGGGRETKSSLASSQASWQKRGSWPRRLNTAPSRRRNSRPPSMTSRRRCGGCDHMRTRTVSTPRRSARLEDRQELIWSRCLGPATA